MRLDIVALLRIALRLSEPPSFLILPLTDNDSGLWGVALLRLAPAPCRTRKALAYPFLLFGSGVI